MTPDRNVERNVPEASAGDTPSVSPERSSVGRMRGGVDPRELARLSARARRAKAEQARARGHRSDSEAAGRTPPERDGGGSPLVGPHERIEGFGGSGVPWTIEAARRAALDPKTPAYVAQRAREWLHEQEQKLAARQEREPVVARRGIDLEGVVVNAVAFGVMAPAAIADVSILEQAYALVASGSTHLREQEAIRARLAELGRVIERTEPPKASPAS
jgi:hypothetical protein